MTHLCLILLVKKIIDAFWFDLQRKSPKRKSKSKSPKRKSKSKSKSPKRKSNSPK